MTLDIQFFKQKLDEEKKLLESELNSVGKQSSDNPAVWEATEERNPETADQNIKADVHEDIEERHAIIDPLEERLLNVNKALQSVIDGSYGMCEVGGEKIEEDRLKANPAARTCKKHMSE